MDDLTCVLFRRAYSKAAFVGDKTDQKIELGKIFSSGAVGKLAQQARIKEALSAAKITYTIHGNSHKHLVAGSAHQEVTWAFYYWCQLNLPNDPLLLEIDRILLNGKTFEEHYLRPVMGRIESNDPPPFIVPNKIANFVGRKKERQQLHAVLMQDGMHAAVQGWPGVGKTSFAIDYAHRYRKDYAGMWWCRAEKGDDLLRDLQKVAQSLDAPFKDEASEKAATACMEHLASLHGTYLLIYDNAEGPQHIDGLMPSAGGRVLITSRFSDWHTQAKLLPLDVLPLQEAVTFLQHQTGILDAAGAKRLAEVLGCLPLALDHAAAYCRDDGKFNEYTTQVTHRIAERPPDSPYPASIYATFRMAIDKAVASCLAAEALIAFCAYCAPDRIPTLMIEGAVASQDERTAAVQALRNASLIKFDPFPDTGLPAWTVHRLVQEVARARSKESRTSVINRIGAVLNQIYPKKAFNEADEGPLSAALTPHVQTLYNYEPHESGLDDFSTAFDAAGLYLTACGDWKSAPILLCKALEIRRNISAEAKLLTRTISNLALFYHTSAELEKSIELNLEALNIRKEYIRRCARPGGYDFRRSPSRHGRNSNRRKALCRSA